MLLAIVKSLQVILMIAEISPVFKKLDNTSKDNYRPISTLSNFISPVFGKIVTHRIFLESWNFRLNNGSKDGAIIMDLSKASKP